MSNTEILALVDLLDDPDEVIFESVRNRLLSEGPTIVNALESFWEHNFHPLRQERIENLVHEIQFTSLKNRIHNWIRLGGGNLLSGAMLVAQYQYPAIEEEPVKKEVEKIKSAIWLEINDDMTGLEKIHAMNQVFFKHYGFQGDKESFHHPMNSQIHKVIERKKGNPLSLSILYLVLAQELELPLYGVNLPQHFVMAYKDEYHVLLPDEYKTKHGVLFYINAFSNGKVFGKAEIDDFIHHLKLEKKDSYYSPCDNLTIIKRMLKNLQFAYKHAEKEDKEEDVKKLVKLFEV
ncbi:transglutaminase-like domain-containing protein [Flavobacteriales bacterium]|nr:transglutaminase-like domain-containing protein [Flavobacteriales bacterium]